MGAAYNNDTIKMVDSRAAAHTMNGFMYQRYYSLYKFFEEFNNEDYDTIGEEGYEDIDLTKKNGMTTIIQIKYHTTTTPESISKGSGLMKVIESMENINNLKKIDKIWYIAHNNGKNILNKDVIKVFKIDKKFTNIGKYVLLVPTNLKKKKKKDDDNNDYNDNDNDEYDDAEDNEKINEENNNNDNDKGFTINLINNDDKLDERYNKKINEIKKNKLHEKFSDVNFCNDYFEKFNFIDGLNINDLKLEICNKIGTTYDSFVGNVDDNERCLRTEAIFFTVFNIFDDKMFEIPGKTADSKQKRQLKFEKIKEKINEKIKMFSCDNLESELIKMYNAFFTDDRIEVWHKMQYVEKLDNLARDDLIKNKEGVVKCFCNLINNKNVEIDREKLNEIIVKIVWHAGQYEFYTEFCQIKKVVNVLQCCVNFFKGKNANKKRNGNDNYPKEKLLRILRGEQLSDRVELVKGTKKQLKKQLKKGIKEE